jgi:hypothetical protein
MRMALAAGSGGSSTVLATGSTRRRNGIRFVGSGR